MYVQYASWNQVDPSHHSWEQPQAEHREWSTESSPIWDHNPWHLAFLAVGMKFPLENSLFCRNFVFITILRMRAGLPQVEP